MKKESLKLTTKIFILAVIGLLTACAPGPSGLPVETAVTTMTAVMPEATLTATSEPHQARVMTICMGNEPKSLFIYGDLSASARSVQEAIYDGPFDVINGSINAVIFEQAPSLAGGDAFFEPIQVSLGQSVVDSTGSLTTLAEGVTVFPAGCSESACAQAYSGTEALAIDQLVVRYKLLPDLTWSDGTPLTAGDVVYSYEVAKDLFPRIRPDLIRRTASVRALDEQTVEWRGLPGYRDPLYPSHFFTPLPQHAWGSLPAEELLTAEQVNHAPLSWGPYVIDEWTAGDHITLSKNARYFRAGEGLPYFDHLVFRFTYSGDEAVSALLAGECDLADEVALAGADRAVLAQYQAENKLSLIYEPGVAWEHLDFSITPADPQKIGFFETKEVRQAVAACIDRQAIAAQIYGEQASIPDSYALPGSPLAGSQLIQYPYDPATAASLLQAAGWVDADNNPATPRSAQSVDGVPDGTSFTVNFLTIGEAEQQTAAQAIQTSLARCGIQVIVTTTTWEKLMAAGPDGPVFGRNFDLAQYAWSTTIEPPCFLYTSSEIPGSYPEYPKGWGGANASGYSSPEFDQACAAALTSLPDEQAHASAHAQAQAIFAEDLPALPLYMRVELAAAKPDLCGFETDPSAGSILWNLENFNRGAACGSE